ncbi:BZ3500_MvSof-1268-A1-R1_Chr10-2g02950 [Microbotryum saponariae]|uniref:BZ3500_MvSof-1268-A1-R1_Chr10-2g02950 protein n=1 Tax=Microbotryum saponariae TaxID=289078 RepID=A0A2X0LRG2_9BASI|nr:BZ3501_MvSof-1269-A2-R1_Chr10-2g02536 [Microbotryum saponariae]SDA01803.1 BZ3500_MvSof-1268-A1-R1_Chr10-2g02950 [Microbotryum saponariae]
MSSNSSTASIEGPQGLSFFTKTWTPPQGTATVATVCFVHGLSFWALQHSPSSIVTDFDVSISHASFVEHLRRYDHVFDRFAQQGLAVFAYDQRGFGQTAVDLGGNNQGVTSWPQQLADLAFFVDHASKLNPDKPLFLYGHSMGGGLALAFPTRVPPSVGVEKIKGVIAGSPLIEQSPGVKASGIVVTLGGLVGKLSGSLTMPVQVKPEDVSRDPEVAKIYAADPLCKQQGSFRGLSDMLKGGEALLNKDYKNWPKDLPLLVIHGEDDKVSPPNNSNSRLISRADPARVNDSLQVTWCESSKKFVEKVQKAGGNAEYKGYPGFYVSLSLDRDAGKSNESDLPPLPIYVWGHVTLT